MENTRAERQGFIRANSWVALCAAHDLALKKPSSFVLVPERGLEPPRVAPHDFESCASTIPPLRH
jgi:hypothetical protein